MSQHFSDQILLWENQPHLKTVTNYSFCSPQRATHTNIQRRKEIKPFNTTEKQSQMSQIGYWFMEWCVCVCVYNDLPIAGVKAPLLIHVVRCCAVVMLWAVLMCCVHSCWALVSCCSVIRHALTVTLTPVILCYIIVLFCIVLLLCCVFKWSLYYCIVLGFVHCLVVLYGFIVHNHVVLDRSVCVHSCVLSCCTVSNSLFMFLNMLRMGRICL